MKQKDEFYRKIFDFLFQNINGLIYENAPKEIRVRTIDGDECHILFSPAVSLKEINEKNLDFSK